MELVLLNIATSHCNFLRKCFQGMERKRDWHLWVLWAKHLTVIILLKYYNNFGEEYYFPFLTDKEVEARVKKKATGSWDSKAPAFWYFTVFRGQVPNRALVCLFLWTFSWNVVFILGHLQKFINMHWHQWLKYTLSRQRLSHFRDS